MNKPQPIPKKQLIGYCRVSSRKQAGNYSLEFQKEKITEFAKKHGYKLIKVYSEQINGSFVDRPKFNKALALLKKHPDAKLIALKPDRLSRNRAEIFNLIDGVLKDRLLFWNLGDRLPDSLILGVLFVFADHERKLISERTQAGREKAKKAGKYKANKPQHKKRFLKAMGKKAIITQQKTREEKIKRILPVLKPIKNLPYEQQAIYLNNLNYLTFRGKQWTAQTIGIVWRQIKNSSQ